MCGARHFRGPCAVVNSFFVYRSNNVLYCLKLFSRSTPQRRPVEAEAGPAHPESSLLARLSNQPNEFEDCQDNYFKQQRFMFDQSSKGIRVPFAFTLIE